MFEFAFANLQRQKIIYMEIWTDFSIFSWKGISRQSYLFVNVWYKDSIILNQYN